MIQKNQPGMISVALRTPDGSALLNNATIEAGDFRIALDGGAFEDMDLVPATTVNEPFATISFIADETNADLVSIIGRDQTNPAEWQEVAISFNPTTVTEEVERIPRSVTALAAGEEYTRTGTAFTSDPVTGIETVTESIG